MLSAKVLLEKQGYEFVKDGRCWFTTSPFNPQDSDPSFAIFPDGGWYCFSTSQGGNTKRLAQLLNLPTTGLPEWTPDKGKPQKPWTEVPSYYLDVTTQQQEDIHFYANSRGITRGYTPAVYYSKNEPVPALMFLHSDGFTITGANFRDIWPGGRRYTMRGALNFYILENVLSYPPTLYMVEGEINANSLWEYCCKTERSVVVLSTGSVTRIPTSLPEKYQGLEGYLIVDYDGDENKWKKRIEKYAHLKLSPIKLCLPKGEDLNSLWIRGKMYLIDNLLK